MYLQLAKSEEEHNFLFESRTHPEVDKKLSGTAPQSYEKHIEYINRVQEKTRYIYVAYAENFMVGYSQIYDITENHVEVGFVIHPNYQGKGYGKEIVLKTIEKAKEQFTEKKIILYVLINNPKAIHIYEKLGFEKKGTKDDTFYMELNQSLK